MQPLWGRVKGPLSFVSVRIQLPSPTSSSPNRTVAVRG